MKGCSFSVLARQIICCVSIALFCATFADAHGIVGNRFFPPTMTTDDPFAVDELALPTISYFKSPAGDGEAATREIDAGFEFDKEIFPRFALGVSNTHISLNPDEGSAVDGWDNLTLTAKYQFWQSDKHEAIMAIGLETDVGGTGSNDIGESFTTFTPTFFFGKGFGDLPENWGALRAFALTGSFGQHFPTSSEAANSLEWGFALEYSIPYLQQHVRDTGLPAPFKDMTPLIEFSFETGENRDEKGITTGTINPGILWDTRQFQIGVEALIPINHESGDHVGVIVQMWIFIDDLFPKTFGHPIFGDSP